MHTYKHTHTHARIGLNMATIVMPTLGEKNKGLRVKFRDDRCGNEDDEPPGPAFGNLIIVRERVYVNVYIYIYVCMYIYIYIYIYIHD